jgi:hypothetical protein
MYTIDTTHAEDLYKVFISNVLRSESPLSNVPTILKIKKITYKFEGRFKYFSPNISWVKLAR